MVEPVQILATLDTTDEPKRSLHRKLAQVMYEAERIPKNGTAPAAMGGFKFVQVGDAADVIRKALAEHSVSMLPTSVELIGETEHSTSSGKSMTTITVRTTWTLTDGDSGESITIQSMGSGADMGDKAIPKAQSNSMKYALLVGFLLSTGDDPEMTDTSDRRPRDWQAGTVVLTPNRPPLERTTHDDGLIGTVATSGTSDFNLRETPDGHILPFRLKAGRPAGQIVFAHDALALALEPLRDALIGERVTVWGTYTDEESPPKADGFVVRYKVLHLSRIKWADGELPKPDHPEHRGLDPAVHGEPPPEAPSAPLFDDDLAGLPVEWTPV
jgi:hypothetical protein